MNSLKDSRFGIPWAVHGDEVVDTRPCRKGWENSVPSRSGNVVRRAIVRSAVAADRLRRRHYHHHLHHLLGKDAIGKKKTDRTVRDLENLSYPVPPPPLRTRGGSRKKMPA